MIEKQIGILDPLGLNNNPLTGRPYSDEYKELAKKWSKLPAYKDREKYIDIIRNNKVILIESETGSGKTVLGPKYALHVLNYDKNVAVTIPKQIITQGAAEYAAKTLDVSLEEQIVGYAYKDSDPIYFNETSNHKLVYMTDGKLSSLLEKDNNLLRFDIVIIDEAHERNVRIDLLLYKLKKVLENRPEFKLIIMSATIDVELFKSYYSDFKFINFKMSGTTSFPIQDNFLKKSIEATECDLYALDIIKEIIKSDNLSKPGAHDIIYFVATIGEIKNFIKIIENNNLDVYCIGVYSGMPKDLEEIAKNDLTEYKIKTGKNRKLVISTPVAESSLTINGLKYVIDSGYEFTSIYYPLLNAQKMEKKRISQSSSIQRRGRVGRTEPGVWYPLFTEDEFNNLKKFKLPDIITSDITSDILSIINKKDVRTLENAINELSKFIEPPRSDYFERSFKRLKNYFLIDDNGITKFGEIIANVIGIPVDESILYFLGELYGATEEIILINLILSEAKKGLSDIFNFPQDNELMDESQVKLLKNKFYSSLSSDMIDHSSDIVTIWRIYTSFISYYEKKSYGTKIDIENIPVDEDAAKNFCNKYFLKFKFLKNIYDKYRLSIKEVRSELPFGTKEITTGKKVIKKDTIYVDIDDAYIKKIKVILDNRELKSINIEDKLKIVFYYTYKHNTAILYDKTYTYKNATDIQINKFSFLKSKKPRKVFFKNLLITENKKEINIITQINDNLLKHAHDITQILSTIIH